VRWISRTLSLARGNPQVFWAILNRSEPAGTRRVHLCDGVGDDVVEQLGGSRSATQLRKLDEGHHGEFMSWLALSENRVDAPKCCGGNSKIAQTGGVRKKSRRPWSISAPPRFIHLGAHSLDHLVGAGEYRGRQVEAERLCCLDDQLVLRGLLNRQVRWFAVPILTTSSGCAIAWAAACTSWI
jgi:hypothetical protein